MSSIKGPIPLDVLFHKRLSSIKGCLQLSGVFYQRSSSIKVIFSLPSEVELYWKNIWWKLIRVPKNLGADPLPEPLSHFGANWWSFWIVQIYYIISLQRCLLHPRPGHWDSHHNWGWSWLSLPCSRYCLEVWQSWVRGGSSSNEYRENAPWMWVIPQRGRVTGRGCSTVNSMHTVIARYY